jgi:tripartite-type tricarboxylate transporter receptor subunit TctC
MLKNLLRSFAIATVLLFNHSYASTFPSQPLTVIIPFGPGSGTDTVMRIIQPALEKQLGVPVVVKNIGGAGGAIGTRAIADAPSDGHTIGMSVVSTFATNLVFRKQSYDPLNDFSYLTRIGSMPRAMIVNNQFPTTDHQALLTELNRNPEKYFYTTVVNSVDMLNAEVYKSATGAKMSSVPYADNSATARIDIKANRAQITFDSLPVLTPFVKNGDFKLVAITGNKRNSEYPNVPTFAELGIKDLTASSWYGFVAPKHLPKSHQEILTKALHKAINDPEVVAKIAALGIDVNTSTPAEHYQDIVDSISLYSKIANRLKIVPQP